LEVDRSATALGLKADIAWRARRWPLAAQLLEETAGESWRGDAPLTRAQQSAVMRAAVAYSLANNRDGVRRLAAQFGEKMAEGAYAASWRTVTSERDVDGVMLRDLAQRIAEAESFDAFLDEFRARRASTYDGPAEGEGGSGADE
jgi:hypothetical protein